MKILDLGCGKNKYKGKNKEDIVIGVDKIKIPDVDVVWNLEKFPWPFKNNEFDLVITSYVIEHISDLIKLMEEIHRISKKNAIVDIRVPYFSHYGAYQDPTHKRFFILKTFDYFTDTSKLNYYSKKRFKIIKKELKFSTTRKSVFVDFFINGFSRFYERFLSNILPAEELHFVLKVIK